MTLDMRKTLFKDIQWKPKSLDEKTILLILSFAGFYS